MDVSAGGQGGAPGFVRGRALSDLNGRMLAILPAFDTAFEARQALRDIAQSALYGTEASIQAGDLPPEEPADRKHGQGIDQHLHSLENRRWALRPATTA